MIDPKLIAIYFPQFHAIPENDKWWGKGFTDWQLVENAKPLFRGHEQPKLPLLGTYNPCEKETLKEQAALAKQYGIHGFMFYHYWFDGKLLLEKPLETLLHNPDIDIDFCVCWANGTWTRAWLGKPEVLIEQQHKCDPNIWKAHFEYLLPFFKDSRAIKKNGKPVFLIYQPNLLKNTKEMFEYWEVLAKENGLPGLYIIAIKNYDFASYTSFLEYYDGIMKFQPREAYNSEHFKGNVATKVQFLRRLPPKLWQLVQKAHYRFKKYTVVDSGKVWDVILRQAFVEEFPQCGLDIYECGYLEWDNTSRYKDKSTIFTRPNRENLEKYVNELYVKAASNDSEFVFWNAWNEWSEGTYLEPDKVRGYENIEILQQAFQEKKSINVSVCMATYNGSKYVMAQIESILKQLSDDDEIVVSDDGSTDDTLEMVKRLKDPRIKIYIHNTEGCKYGSITAKVTANFENALKHAKGDIIFLADQDDVWCPDKVQVMVNSLKDYDLVVSDAYVTDSDLRVVHDTRFFAGCGQTKDLRKAYFTTHPYQGSCMAFKRAVMEKALPFPKCVKSHDLWLGLIGNSYFKAKLIPEKLMYYRRHNNVVSVTGGKSPYSLWHRIYSRVKYLLALGLRIGRN